MKLNERKLDNALRTMGLGAAVLVVGAVVAGILVGAEMLFGTVAAYVVGIVILMLIYGVMGYVSG